MTLTCCALIAIILVVHPIAGLTADSIEQKFERAKAQFPALMSSGMATMHSHLLLHWKGPEFARNPLEWCTKGTELYDIRKTQESLIALANTGMLARTAYTWGNASGDWGVAVLASLFGVKLGNRISCFFVERLGGSGFPLSWFNMFIPPAISSVVTILWFQLRSY